MDKSEWMQRAMQVRHPTAARLVFILMAFIENQEPGVHEYALAQALGCSVHQVRQGLAELERLGLAQHTPTPTAATEPPHLVN